MAVEVKEVAHSINRSTFRRIARDSTGETYECPEGSRLLFAYKFNDQMRRNEVVGVASFTTATVQETPDASSSFVSDRYYHHLSYLFVGAPHKKQGIGSQLLKAAEKKMTLDRIRPIRVESAYKAIPFFEKNCYKAVGDIIECCCPGSQLFRRMQHMQKDEG